jgi:hypothetical protein
MQKVVGSNPIIRFEKAPLDGAFRCLDWNRQRPLAGDSAHSCPFEGPVVLAQVRPRETFSPLRRLRVDLQREARILVPELQPFLI